ncbi:MAG: hypothetical protein M0000_07690 [Actinomycetota bacterium]|nr:hypothetical protein [Actinomycetota bacterium]
MNGTELSERVETVHAWLRRLVRRFWFVGALVISVGYLGAWFVLQRSAHFHRQVDFFNQTGKSWVQLGAMRFTPERWDAFVGTVFHPVVFAIVALPAALASVLLLSALALSVLGYVTSKQEERAEARRRKEDQEFVLKRMEIRAGEAQRKCMVCGRKRENNAAVCPGCGAAYTEA